MNGVSNQRDSPTLGDGIELIRKSGTDACVLISVRAADLAETVARRIHAIGRLPHGHFVAVDCASSAQVLDEDLFGRLAVRPGRPPCTLFLKEIGRLGGQDQHRLLATLTEATMANWPRRIPARVIAFASEPLIQRVVDGTFDDRLFYRLNVIHLDLLEE